MTALAAGTGGAEAATSNSRARARRLRLLRLDLRSMAPSAAVLGLLISGFTAIVVLAYPATVATPEDLAGLELVAGNPAIRLLFGVPRALDTAGGFTVWRLGTICAAAIAAWALAVAARLSRGDEDTGRCWLLLACPIRLSTTVAVHLAAVGGVVVVQAAATAVAMLVSGADVAGALLYAVGLGAIGWFFAALGACCGQLMGERTLASGLASGLLVVGLVIRMVGDGLEPLSWIRWLTPFGLLSLSAPYAGDRWLPVLVLAVAALAVGGLTARLANRRDVGTGLVPTRSVRRPRTAFLTSTDGFALRRTLPSLFGWGAALIGYFLLIGLLAVSLTTFLTENPRFAALAAAAGFGDLARVDGYVASLFRLVPIPLGLYAAVRIARLADDETRGRLTLPLSTPVRRITWPLSEARVVAGASLVLALATGAAAWVGTTIVGAGFGLAGAIAGTVNVLPLALLSLGAAVFAWGWLPRAVLLVGALPTVGGFAWWVLAESLGWSDRVRAFSPYAHLAGVPAEPPDLAAAAVMLGLTGALLLGGLVGFARRDLRV